MTNEYKLVVISGPSGCGKDTAVKKLLTQRDDIKVSVSCTTRAPREGEKEGVDYYYITREEFLKRIENGRMLEYNEYVGNMYGTPMDELEKGMDHGDTELLVIDVNGGKAVKKIYPGAELIFLLPPSMEELKRRMLERKSETEESAAWRLKVAQEEMEEAKNYDISIVNDDLDRCVSEISNAIDEWQKTAEKNINNHKEEKNMNKTQTGRLLENNESAYSLVIAVAKRARAIVAEAEKNGEKLTEKAVTTSINEFDEGKYSVKEAE